MMPTGTVPHHDPSLRSTRCPETMVSCRPNHVPPVAMSYTKRSESQSEPMAAGCLMYRRGLAASVTATGGRTRTVSSCPFPTARGSSLSSSWRSLSTRALPKNGPRTLAHSRQGVSIYGVQVSPNVRALVVCGPAWKVPIRGAATYRTRVGARSRKSAAVDSSGSTLRMRSRPSAWAR